MSIKVSIIVSIYKVEKYLKKCIDSLLNQTYNNIEIILVDDGSPDNCGAICDSYAAQYDKIISLHKKNGGLSDARNFGVVHANTEWIVFVDSDDYVEPSYIENLIVLQNKYKTDMVITRTVRENEDGSGKSPINNFKPFIANAEEALFEVYSGQRIGWAAYGKLYKKHLLIKHPFPIGFYEDCACMYKIIHECTTIAIGNFERNYHYIQRDGSILVSQLNEKHLHIFEICKEFEVFIKKNYPALDILPILVYRRGVTQLLNLQSMSWSTYKTIFYKYRLLFRNNIWKVCFDKRINCKSKILLLLLCTSPEFFYLQRKIIIKIRSK